MSQSMNTKLMVKFSFGKDLQKWGKNLWSEP